MKEWGLGVLAAVGLMGFAGLVFNMQTMQEEIDALRGQRQPVALGAARPLPGYAPREYSISNPEMLMKLSGDIAHLLDGKSISVICAGSCGPLAEQLGSVLKTPVVDIPYANSGLWVSPSSDSLAHPLANILSRAVGKAVQIDTLPDSKDGILSSNTLTIVVSKEPSS